MLNKLIFYQTKDYPNTPIVMMEEMKIPVGDYFKCKPIEQKINEYLNHINLEITIFLLEIEKLEYELFRQELEFAWTLTKEISLSEMNNTIILDKIDKNIFINSYILFEPLYKCQLENIYNFLKQNYSIDRYFRKKYDYELLQKKLLKKDNNKKDLKKI